MPSYASKGVVYPHRDIYKPASFRHKGDIDRGWRQSNSVSRKVSETHKATKTKRSLIVAGFVTMLCIIVVILLIILYKPSENPAETPVECPPGFTETGCQSKSFIGSKLWSDTKVYKFSDGRFYSYGIAFRVYAPFASSISVMTNMDGQERSFAMM